MTSALARPTRAILTGPLAAVTLPQIEKVEKELLEAPQKECPVVSRFAPGCYVRECTMPAETFVIGHCHKTEHFNIVLSGKALVRIGDDVSVMKAGDVFVSEAGVRKILYIVEEMRWLTVHPTNTTNEAELRNELIAPSEAWKQHELDAFSRQVTALLQ